LPDDGSLKLDGDEFLQQKGLKVVQFDLPGESFFVEIDD
jgi:hypothetical protein